MDDETTRPQHKIYDHSLEDEAVEPAPAPPVEPSLIEPIVEPMSQFTPRAAEENPPLPLPEQPSQEFPAQEIEPPLQSPAQEIPAAQDHDLLRLATFAMVQQGLSLGEAAERYGVDPDALHMWHRTYVKFVGKDVLIASNWNPREKIEIDTEMKHKFDQNWDEMMRLAELERPQLSPFHLWLLRSPLTRWMFRDEKLDYLTVAGAVAVSAFSLLAIRAGTRELGGSDAGSGEGGTGGPIGVAAVIDPDNPSSLDETQTDAALGEIAKELEAFAKLETWQERLPFVRKPEQTKPLMEAYYETHEDGPISRLQLDSQVNFIKRSDSTFVLMQGRRVSADAAPGSSEPVIFLAELTTGEPSVLFDWEVMVNYEPVSWEDFVASRSTEPFPFRVRVSRGDYYNLPFMDQEKFVSFAVTPLHRDVLVHAFAPRGSDLAKQLEALVAKELNSNRAMILNLRFPDDARFDDILEIESVATDSWLSE